MASRRRKNDVDLEIDLHGYTADEMRRLLERGWPEWRGMVCVRLVHGRGTVLKPELERWCRELGVAFEMEPNNPGSAFIYPSRRTLPDSTLKIYLKDKGLSLTPEEEATLRNPEAARKAETAALEQRKAEERKRRSDAFNQLLKKRQDEAMWQAEVSRLDSIDKKRGKGSKNYTDTKPSGPIIRPPSEIKHQEGWWNAEIIRVADTDTETLKVQKRTGLDKLAPPITAQKPLSPETPVKARKPVRDTAADQALFDEELARLDGK